MNKICRICLEEGMLSSIFTKNYNITLCEMIEYITNIKISKEDGLPDQMCSNCAYKLGIAYHFKQTCESSDLRLRQYLGLQVISKAKDAEVMTDPITEPEVLTVTVCSLDQGTLYKFTTQSQRTFQSDTGASAEGVDSSTVSGKVIPTQTIIKKCKCRKEPKPTSSNYKKKPESEKLKRGPKPKPRSGKENTCYECDKQFKCQAQLEMHVRTHTGDKPFICMFCPRKFSQKHNLTIHLRVHTGEKPYQCDVCSKTFSAQGNLQAHMKIHTGQKDHICSICNKSFITSSDLTRHMLKHRAIKVHKCDLCNSSYVHSRDLKLHKLKKHDVNEPDKSQNDFTNIDIINIDDKKNCQAKEMPDDKSQVLSSLAYENKAKDEFTNNLVNEPLVCNICGEVFHYMAPLAQHYIQQHKTTNI